MRLSRTAAVCLGCLFSAAALVATVVANILANGETARTPYFEFPDAFGPWALQQQIELSPDELEILGAARHWRRQYDCRLTRQSVVATLVAGDAARIAAHSPDVCYTAGTYQPIATAHVVRIDGVDGAFWTRSFRPRAADQPTLTVVYAWHDGDRWRAPRSPRWELARRHQICRLQVACQHPEWADREAKAALAGFLQHALARPCQKTGPSPCPSPRIANQAREDRP